MIKSHSDPLNFNDPNEEYLGSNISNPVRSTSSPSSFDCPISPSPILGVKEHSESPANPISEPPIYTQFLLDCAAMLNKYTIGDNRCQKSKLTGIDTTITADFMRTLFQSIAATLKTTPSFFKDGNFSRNEGRDFYILSETNTVQIYLFDFNDICGAGAEAVVYRIINIGEARFSVFRRARPGKEEQVLDAARYSLKLGELPFVQELPEAIVNKKELECVGAIYPYCNCDLFSYLTEKEYQSRLTFGHRLELLRQVTVGCKALYQKGILPTDLKPDNVLVRIDAATAHVFVADFQENKMTVRSDGKFLWENHAFTDTQTHESDAAKITSAHSTSESLYYSLLDHTVFCLGELFFNTLGSFRPFNNKLGYVQDSHDCFLRAPVTPRARPMPILEQVVQGHVPAPILNMIGRMLRREGSPIGFKEVFEIVEANCKVASTS